jgi:hypothetical protein
VRKYNAIEPGPQADQVFCGAFHATILAGGGAGRKRRGKVAGPETKNRPTGRLDELQDFLILSKL